TLRDADGLLARGRARLLARLLGQPHAAPAEGPAAGLLHSRPDGRSGAGALRLPQFGELPLGYGLRRGRGDRGPGPQAGSVRGDDGAPGARPLAEPEAA